MAKKDPFNLELSSDVNYIAFDILGGDDGAAERNLESVRRLLEDHARLERDKVGLILVGDRAKIKQEVGNFIQIVHADKQAPMNGSGKERDNSMGVVAQLQRDCSEIVATYSNGSTKHNVSLSMLYLKRKKRNEKEKRRPTIIKELLPGVFFADNGAIPGTTRDDYKDTLQTLEEHNGKKDVMVLPDDEYPDYFIKEYLGHPKYNFIDFDALEFLQSKNGVNILANGFIGNVYLKLIEAFVKDKKGQNLSRKDLEEIRKRILQLEKDEETNSWKIPDGINMEGISCGILCNGVESKKGTPALQEFKKHLEGDESFEGDFRGFIEPEDLIAKPNIRVLATPACTELIESITQPSVLQEKFNPLKWRKLIRLKEETKATAPIAEIEHLKNGRAFVGHGEAKTEATIQNLEYLLDRFAQKD